MINININININAKVDCTYQSLVFNVIPTDYALILFGILMGEGNKIFIIESAHLPRSK